jgi:hypothetical protein
MGFPAGALSVTLDTRAGMTNKEACLSKLGPMDIRRMSEFFS